MTDATSPALRSTVPPLWSCSARGRIVDLLGARPLRARTVVPFDRQCVERLLRLPVVVGDHGDCALRRASSPAARSPCSAAASPWSSPDRSTTTARTPGMPSTASGLWLFSFPPWTGDCFSAAWTMPGSFTSMPNDRFAGDDFRNVQLGRRCLAEKGPFALRFQRRLGGQASPSRLRQRLRHSAIVVRSARASARWPCASISRSRDIPSRRRRGLQALARAGAELQRVLHAHRIGPVSAEEGQEPDVVDALLHVIAVNRAELDFDPRPVARQFLGDIHRDLRHRAIADLGRRHANGHGVIARDLDPGRQFVADGRVASPRGAAERTGLRACPSESPAPSRPRPSKRTRGTRDDRA